MILRERVPCRAPLVGLALIGLLAIAVLPGWTKGQAPVATMPPHVVHQRPVTGQKVQKIPRLATEGEERRVDDQQSARTAISRQATDRYSPQSLAPTEIHTLAEIKQLEARLAASLRGAEQGGVKRAQPIFSSRADSADRQPPNAPTEIEILTRAKYKLPPGRAEALAAFIKEQVKDDVETKVEGETLVVTATADDQTRIGQFVQLLKTTPEVCEEAEEFRDAPEEGERSTNNPFAAPADFGEAASVPLPAVESSDALSPFDKATQPQTAPSTSE